MNQHHASSASLTWLTISKIAGLAILLTACSVVLVIHVGFGWLNSRAPMLAVLPAGPFAAVVCESLRGYSQDPIAWTLRVRQVAAIALLVQVPLYVVLIAAGARKRRLKVAVCSIGALHLAMAFFGGPLFWGPSLSDFKETIRETAGESAQTCGFTSFESPSSAALDCAARALEEGRPFWVAIQGQGADSTICIGLVAQPDGSCTCLQWDSDVQGGSGVVPLRKIFQTPCQSPSIERTSGRPTIKCSDREDDGDRDD